MRGFTRLCALYADSPLRLAGALACTVAAVLLHLAIPLILKSVLDDGLDPANPGFVYVAGALLVGATALRSAAVYGQNYLVAFLAQRLAYRLRNLLYDKLQRLSFAYHDRAQTGDLMSRAAADVEAVRHFFHFGFPMVFSILLTGVGTTAALAWLDWRLAVLAVGGFAVILAVSVTMGRWLRPLQEIVQAHTARLSVAWQESLTGIRVVKAFGREDAQEESFLDSAGDLYRAHMRVTHAQALSLPLLTLLLALGLGLTLYVGGREVILGRMSLGTLVAATSYLVQLGHPLRRLSWLAGMASRCQAGGRRLFEVLDAVSEVRESPRARPLPQVRGALRFENVSFRYDRHLPVLHDISFSAEPGQTVALLGGTGSGKSTLAQLIPRFYDPTGGVVSLDGIDVRDLQLDALRRHIGIVMQDTWLFSSTIRDNIAYGRPDIGLEAVVAAAKAAHAHDFIMTFPNGYDTWVGERGVTLSGGQRQRVAIARAFVRDPRLLILDDATSSVDVETEFLIQRALRGLMVGRTTVVIAHRLYTLRHADLILVLSGGRIVQRGTHDELLDEPGLYRRVYQQQSRDPESEPAPDLIRGSGQAPDERVAPAVSPVAAERSHA